MGLEEPLNSNEVPEAASPPQHLVRKTVIRGGWSTSIQALFDDPRRHSNFCAVTCCGILLSDRNAFLVNGGQDQANWRLRRGLNITLPLALLIIISVLSNSSGGQAQLVVLLRLAFFATIVVLLIRGRVQRAKLRTAINQRMVEQRQQSAGTPQQQHVVRDEFSHNATGCCCCFPNDITYILAPVSTDTDTESLTVAEEFLEGQRILAVEAPQPDLCTCMWKAISNMCCASLCGCWLQMCGMCAIGQEDRELERLFLEQPGSSEADARKLFQIDYISFQAFSDYYPLILNLRQANETSFYAHFKTLSKLSQQIIRYFARYLVMVGIISALTGKLMHFGVLLATHAQAIFVLYLVHWKWHKLTVSVDSVIKYFASGFVFSIFMAMIIELVMMLVLYPVGIIFIVVEAQEEAGSTPVDVWMADPTNIHDFVKKHLGQFAFISFIFSFGVAALVEEICKYFGFWMVETPDLTKPEDLVLTGEQQQQHYHPGLVRRGASITIAMVAVATGFACAENLQYVMQQASVWDEITLLLIRSVFPVHQLCAAIQSIGVVQRDLEGDRKSQLGRLILPAILLHGSFDFFAFFWSIFEIAETDVDDSDASAVYSPDDPPSPLDLAELLKTLAVCSPSVFAGLFYFYSMSQKQRTRLSALDHVQGEGSTLRLVEAVGNEDVALPPPPLSAVQ